MQFRLNIHHSLPSTMDGARVLAQSGVPEGVVVQALTQTAGLGRFGNQWESPQGNLYMTILLRPGRPHGECAQVSFVAAVALAQACDEFGIADIQLKWPNDVLVEGKKLAGILLEADAARVGDSPAFLLVGIGVNVAHAPEGRFAIRMQNPAIDLNLFRETLLSRFGQWYDVWLQDGFQPVRSAWVERAYGLGQPMTARLMDRRTSGVFVDIDKNGALVMKDDNTGKARMISGGEIHFG